MCEDTVRVKLPNGWAETFAGLAVFTFEDGKTKGERTFFNSACAAYMQELLKDYWSFPGVSKI